MSTPVESPAEIAERVRRHLMVRIRAATVWLEPFCHTVLEDVFPSDVYAELLAHLPPAERYWTGPLDGGPVVRTFYNLTTDAVRRLPGRIWWCAVAAVLTDPEVKRCLFARLAPDLAYRFGVPEDRVPDLEGHPRPTLYREVAGYELPPHPDTLKKVVTMHLYLPADLGQIDLGTALYRRDDTGGFVRVKQFEFRPNSGYAFVVNDGPGRQSWHGRERLRDDAGVRNTLLNTFYAAFRPGYVFI